MRAGWRLGAASALLLLSAGCDGGDEPTNVTKIKVADSGAYLERLRGLSQQNRDLALRRAIQDAGKSCRRIESSAESGSYETMAIWTAHCEGGRDWAVFVAPGGDVQVRNCANVEQLGLPACAMPETGQ